MGGALAAVLVPGSALSFGDSLKDRAKWRSFGDGDWFFDDPFERSRPGATRLPYEQWQLHSKKGPASQLLDLIGFAEAGRHQYDAIHMSATRLPARKPTQLTLAQIFAWIRQTPGQHHAIGRYQFIPSTLLMLTRRAGMSHATVFSPDIQDRLAILPLQDAGFSKAMAGRMSPDRFMDNLARIWAGLPKRNGRSHYDGYAGNRATISRSFFQTQVIAIIRNA